MGQFWFGRAVALAMALACCVGPVDAKPVVKTKYTYYTISGFDARSLHEAMVRYGPHVNGENAYAATEVSGGQDGLLDQSANQCKIRNYVVQLEFKIRLPKLKPGVALKPDVQRRWKTFEAFVRQHEETHRRIWIECASKLEQQIKSLRMRDCERMRSVAQATMDKAWAACSKRHDAFDAQQRSPLMKQPFIQSVAVTGGKTRTVTLKAPRANFTNASP